MRSIKLPAPSLIANPGIPCVGWLLLLHAMLPRDGEGRAILPDAFYGAAWIVMAVGYSYGGLKKLGSPSWLDGSALARVLESPLARDTALRAWLTAMPALLRALTWAALALEILAAPIALSKRLRPWLWLAFVALQLGILATVDFADLTLGMLMIHVLTFDPGWVRARSMKAHERNKARDGEPERQSPPRARMAGRRVSCDACGRPPDREWRHPAAEPSRVRASGPPRE